MRPRHLTLLAIALLVSSCRTPAPTDQPHAFTGPGFTQGGAGGGGAGTVTNVTGGTGVTVTNGTSTPNVALDSAVWQKQVTTTCAAGQFLTAVASDGTATCTAEPGDISSVVAGTSLTGGGTSGAVTLNVAVPGASCAAGTSVTAISAAGGGTCTANVSSIVAGTSITQSTTNGAATVNVALPATSCTASKSVTAIGADGTGTCTTPIVNDYAQTHLEWVDEYMFNSCYAAAAIGGSCGSIWTQTASGAGTQVTSTGTTTRPGVAQFTTGTTTTGRVALTTSYTAVDFGSGNWSFEWTGGFETLSTAADEYRTVLGFGDTDSSSTNEVDGCYFQYDRGNVATAPGTGAGNTSNFDKWECWCASNSVRTGYVMDGSVVSQESFTTVNAPVAALALPSTNIQTLKLVMTGTTRAEFFVNGTKSCDINTNIPSGSSRLTGVLQYMLKSAGTNARTMDVDRTRVVVDLTSARSP